MRRGGSVWYLLEELQLSGTRGPHYPGDLKQGQDAEVVYQKCHECLQDILKNGIYLLCAGKYHDFRHGAELR